MIRQHDRDHHNGVTLIEVSISILLVGVLMVAGLRALAGSAQTGLRNQQRAQSILLAKDLIAELLSLPYSDPDGSTGIGREPDESGALLRSELDDLDDFHLWNESPPVDQFGVPIPYTANWIREATVEYVDPADLSQVVASDLGVKRVTVTISNPISSGLPIRLTAYQTAAWSKASFPQREIWARPNTNRRPRARILTLTPTFGSSPLFVEFDGSSSIDTDGDTLSYSWDFGNGTTSTSATANQSFINNTTRTLAFVVRLTVTDINGAQSSAYKTIVVKP